MDLATLSLLFLNRFIEKANRFQDLLKKQKTKKKTKILSILYKLSSILQMGSKLWFDKSIHSLSLIGVKCSMAFSYFSKSNYNFLYTPNFLRLEIS